MRSDAKEKAGAGFEFMSSVQHLIETSGLSYPQAAALLLTLVCEMIQTAPNYSDDMPSKFVELALPQAIELGKTRQRRAKVNISSTGTMQ